MKMTVVAIALLSWLATPAAHAEEVNPVCGQNTAMNSFAMSIHDGKLNVSIDGDGPKTLATELLTLFRTADSSVGVEEQEFEVPMGETKMAGVTYSLDGLSVTKAISHLCPPLTFSARTPVTEAKQWSVTGGGRNVVTLMPSDRDAATILKLLKASGVKSKPRPGTRGVNYETKNIICAEEPIGSETSILCWLSLDLRK